MKSVVEGNIAATKPLLESGKVNAVEVRLPSKPEPCKVGTIHVDRLCFDEMAEWIVEAMRNHLLGDPLLIVGTNAQVVTLAQKNEALRAAMNAADLSLADGISIVLGSKLLGRPIAGRSPCGEMMERLCAIAALDGYRVFFLGGLEGSAEKASRELLHRYPGLTVAGTYCPPFGFEKDAAESQKINRMVTDAAPDILFLALGAPKQEIWMYKNYQGLPVRVILPVGGAFDTYAGLRKRAPKWTHQIGAEWLYRLVKEPRRLWHRYTIGNIQFLWILISQLVKYRL